jgi:hypothetical protein
MPDWSRRAFIVRAGAVGWSPSAPDFLGAGCSTNSTARRSAAGRRSLRDRHRPAAAEADLSSTIPGLTPIVMPNDKFYRIDTALLVPVVDTAGWTLRIHGWSTVRRRSLGSAHRAADVSSST